MPYSERVNGEVLQLWTGQGPTNALTWNHGTNGIHGGLSTNNPDYDGSGVIPGTSEPNAGNYSRVTIAAADWRAVFDDGNSRGADAIDNQNELAFATANADWLAGASLKYAHFWDAAAPTVTAANYLGWKDLVQAKGVFSSDTAKFLIGDLKIVMGGALNIV